MEESEANSRRLALKARLTRTHGKQFSRKIEPSRKLAGELPAPIHPGRLGSPKRETVQRSFRCESPQAKPRIPTSYKSVSLALKECGEERIVKEKKPVVYNRPMKTKTPGHSQRNYKNYASSPFAFIDSVINEPTTERFVYLRPIGPYNLEIAEHSEVNSENFYTMSRAGVTHFFGNETSFASLAQWEREYFLYNRMMKVSFFAQYRMWKSFYYWKQMIRRRKRQNCQKVLQENLLILNPYLREPLFRLRELCYFASNWEIFKIDSWQTSTLRDFIDNQRKQREHVTELLNELGEQTRSIVLDACDVDLREFLITNGFRTNSLEDSATSDENAKIEDDERQKISHAEKAAIRTECRKLTKYIRLSDFLVIDTLVSLAKSRTEKLLLQLTAGRTVASTMTEDSGEEENSRDPTTITESNDFDMNANEGNDDKETVQKEAIFSIEMGLSTAQEFVFTPLFVDFQTCIEKSIYAAVKTVMTSERLLDDEELRLYTQINVDDNGDEMHGEVEIEAMVLQDVDFRSAVQNIRRALTSAFAQVNNYALSFGMFLDIFREPSPDLELYRKEQCVTVFSDLIDKYNKQISTFEEIPLSNTVGVIRVETEALKRQMLPVPQQRLALMHQLLPELSAEKCSSLLELLKKFNTKISKIPDSVNDFVEFMSFLATTHENEEMLEEQYSIITDLYNLIEEHSIVITNNETSNFDRLNQARSTLKTSVSLSEASIDDDIARFSKELSIQIPQLKKDIVEIEKQMKDPRIASANSDLEEVVEFIETQNFALIECEKLSQRYQCYQQVLEVEISSFEHMAEVRFNLNMNQTLWLSIQSWTELTMEWVTTKLNDIDAEAISNKVHQYLKTVMKASRVLEGNEAANSLKDRIDEFKATLPIVIDLRNPSLTERHWKEINELLNHNILEDNDFTLGTLLDIDAKQHQQGIAMIAVKAVQEQNLLAQLEKVIATWRDLDFIINNYKDQKDVYVLGSLEDITVALDESLVTINTIVSSRFVEPLKKQVEEWSAKLVLFQETIDEWVACQRKWRYLETIFSAQDIMRQLPEDSKRFAAVNRSWRDIMQRTVDDPNALRSGTVSGLKDTFIAHNAALDRIEKRLEDYLETKRQAFPRFYFLSNDELLEILAQSKNVHAVQPHLRKCFDNILKLDFGNDPKSTDILAMISGEGERVPLGKTLKARGSVEMWLNALESDMVKSLHKCMKQGVMEYSADERDQWVLNQFGQVVMTVTQIEWARGCESALRTANPVGAMKSWYEQQLAQLSQLTQLVRSPLSKIDRQKVVALVTTDVHARDVIRTMLDAQVDDISNFRWQQQLRFYWDVEKDDCLVKQVNATFDYGYEYMGVTSRLVITPLTDRCWMTITGALDIKLGASPAGPAGTGKTESVKDLAKAMGIQCVVFNCSDQIDYRMMGKLFSGLAQAGAWTCLDEFNRIDIEVLSVVAQQLLVVRQALLSNASEFLFMDRTISLKGMFGVMITMNPGYAGRTELPDNLKVLFRPVAMMIPDYALIAEIMLFAEGFDSASILSKKMVKLYKLSSEQLSQQDHYDFGMRAVKSVLVMAGALKRAHPDLKEESVLIRAMRDSNIPKFLNDDLPLFGAIVQDLFPGTEIKEQDSGQLQVAIERTIATFGLDPVPSFINNVIQLYDTFNVRFGVMLVGPTGGAKSECSRVLSTALSDLKAAEAEGESFETVIRHTLNPKCINMGELYGEISELSQEWTDGLASTIMRDAITDTTETRHWVIFDGPVDALWIENMNTVLDDNMTLCLANGERIKLKKELRMLFEVQDLAVASPATVSRCGMVYMAAEDIDILSFVQSWMPRSLDQLVPKAVHTSLMKLFKATLELGLNFVRSKCHEPVKTVDINLTTSLCHLFQALYSTENGIKFQTETVAGKAKAIEEDGVVRVEEQAFVNELNSLAETCYVFSFIWSIGGSIDEGDREVFSAFVRETFPNVHIPKAGEVFDYFVDFQSGVWKKWETCVPEFEYDMELPYFNILVPTVDTVTYSYILKAQLRIHQSVYFTGVTGVGKSVVAIDLLRQMKGDGKCLTIELNFSAQTSSRRTQETIEAQLEKKRKTLLGGPAGKPVIIFVDDVNMPAVEEYGAQPPIELLRQFQDYRGFYDREKLFWKDIVDTTICCASAPAGGGRNELTPRFTRHFHMLALPAPSNAVMTRIFGSILSGYLAAAGFKADVRSLCESVVASTIQLYKDISSTLLPSPAKSHYTFNLRDISKVFQGVLMANAQSVPTKEVLTRLWVHEAMRGFHDRLINQQDKLWFTQRIIQLIERNFGFAWKHEEVFENEEAPIIFGDFFRPGFDKTYEECDAIAKVSKVLDEYLDEYNHSASSKMNLVFFANAIKHIVRISRIIRQKRGNAMLVGVGGSGKQSLTKLACSIAEYQCYQIEVRKGYGYAEFREDLKTLMKISGVEGNPVVFLFADTQIIEERFIEDINNLLNSGEIPNLFEADELTQINDDLCETVRKLGLPETRDVIYRTFINRVRDNLHVVLAMSPVGDAFRVRCRMFPSLINCTTIDWFQKWPREALLSVSTTFVRDVELPSEEVRSAIATMCVSLHMSVEKMCNEFWEQMRRRVYTTPKSYLDLISLYLVMLAEKRALLQATRDRLLIGLRKLNETNEVVVSLQKELTELQPELITKSAETEALLKQVAIDQAKADEVKIVVSAEEASVTEHATEVAQVQEEAQADLALALPALEAAVESLNSLNKNDISELKGMLKPPKGVVMVAEAVNTLLGEKTDWDTAKRVMGQSQFLHTLKTYDKDNIPAKRIKKIEVYYNDESFQEEVMAKVSSAALSLCKWVRAMYVYSQVAKEVGPKRERLAKMNQLLDDANTKLEGKRAELKEVVDNVNRLKEQCDAAVFEKNRLNALSDQTQARLQRAEKLTSGLADEAVRWLATSEELGTNIELLVGDVFLAAATISYSGAFTGSFRERLTQLWLNECTDLHIPTSSDYSLVKTLGDPVQTREWNIEGLPTDAVSIDNGILVTRGQRWPLMIDPQGQAKKWIRNNQGKRLRTVRMSDPQLLRILETAVRLGESVLVEDIGEQIEASLDAILLRAVFSQGGRVLIRLGDSDVDYDDSFRFFMTTKLPNPHYLPQICIKVTLINFTVTRDGLEDQLLGDVVRSERPDVETKKDRLVVRMAADKKQLQDIGDRILTMLSESQGNILDDKDLINTLGDSKFTSNIINERVKEAEETQKVIDESREKYRAVARRGSVLYFVVADLASIDPMYQHSLSYFKRLFNVCLTNSPASNDLAQRLQFLLSEITLTLYSNVCRGLFEVHKVIYSFLICAMIRRQSRQINDTEWSLLLQGASAPGMMSVALPEGTKQPALTLIKPAGWALLGVLESMIANSFEGMRQHVLAHTNDWMLWASSADLSATPCPEPFHQRLSLFERLLLIKSFRPDKLMFALNDYVAKEQGEAFVLRPPIELSDVYKDTDKKTPVIFVLSTGADPTSMLLRFAADKGMDQKMHVISLGQGQGPKAAALIEQCSKTGDWCVLQNCHLAKSWMPELEKVVEGLSDNEVNIHDEFRLWLTAMPCTYFPVPVLQNGVKVTNEPPKGLRANVLRSYKSMDETVFEAISEDKLSAFKTLLFGLCFFHAIVQERRKFGPLGWNIRYEFNDSDLETSQQLLRLFLEEQDSIPWDALRYVCGQINYGGRVTDDWDRRCLMSILGKFYTPDILCEGYEHSEAPHYSVPSVGSLSYYLQYIQELPQNDDPVVFGMHENANITFQQTETASLIETVLGLQPRDTSGASGATPDEIVSTMTQEFVETLPEELNKAHAHEKTFFIKPSGVMDSLGTVLLQELERFNRLLCVMRVTLADISRAIRGEIVMSLALDKMYSSFLVNKVPELWSNVAYPSLKPLSHWFKDLQQRVAFVRDWLVNGPPNAFWMSGFFFPQGFLTGVLQNHARKYTIPIDTLSFSFSVLDIFDPEEATHVVEDGVLVYGLFMDGAKWDIKQHSVTNSEIGELYQRMPMIHFTPVTNHVTDEDNNYVCPVYKTSVRAGVLSTTGQSTNFVLAVELPTQRSADYWVLKGAALLCQCEL